MEKVGNVKTQMANGNREKETLRKQGIHTTQYCGGLTKNSENNSHAAT